MHACVRVRVRAHVHKRVRMPGRECEGTHVPVCVSDCMCVGERVCALVCAGSLTCGCACMFMQG